MRDHGSVRRGRTAAIVLAGGVGSRLRRENKVYLPIGSRPLLAWSLETFQASELVDEIVLVIRGADANRAQSVIAATPAPKLTRVVEGGATRHASEHAGLEALAPHIERGEIDLVLIHDAARPFVTHELVAAVVDAARASGGAVPGLPVETHVFRSTDAVHLVSVQADDLRRVQTPQAFRARELLAAYRAAAAEGFHGVDTAESVERFTDLSVQIVNGDPDNIKVTFVEDLFTAEDLASRFIH